MMMHVFLQTRLISSGAKNKLFLVYSETWLHNVYKHTQWFCGKKVRSGTVAGDQLAELDQ